MYMYMSMYMSMYLSMYMYNENIFFIHMYMYVHMHAGFRPSAAFQRDPTYRRLPEQRLHQGGSDPTAANRSPKDHKNIRILHAGSKAGEGASGNCSLWDPRVFMWSFGPQKNADINPPSSGLECRVQAFYVMVRMRIPSTARSRRPEKATPDDVGYFRPLQKEPPGP